MTPLTIFLSVLFFTILGMAWIVGSTFVMKHSPGNIVKFYMILAAIRFLFVATAVLVYAMLISSGKQETKTFVIFFMTLYALMMVLTLRLKHK